MSKLLFPVIASKPLCFLKFDFTGRLDVGEFESEELVTHGGLPNTSTSS